VPNFFFFFLFIFLLSLFLFSSSSFNKHKSTFDGSWAANAFPFASSSFLARYHPIPSTSQINPKTQASGF